MITLRLFKAADPFQEIDSRQLASGAITLGRDSSADWQIKDALDDISRRHCTISTYADVIYLRDHSVNGVATGPDRRRVVRETDHEIRAGDTLYLGAFLLVVDQEETEDVNATLSLRSASAPEVKGRPPVAYPGTEAGLLEAFCDGAGLETSSFMGEDPSALMGRLGALYRQVVDDLGSLLQDRAALKDTLQLDRTTISARENNPLKWAATERVAVDLLKERDTGFLKGAEAMRASFEDLRRHNASVMAGSSAAIGFVLSELSPEKIEAAQPKSQALGFLSRSDAHWKSFQQLHRLMADDLARGGAGQIGAASREAYQQRLRSAGRG